jgi:hypothetical protein
MTAKRGSHKPTSVAMYNCPGYCWGCPHTAYAYMEECQDPRCECHTEILDQIRSALELEMKADGVGDEDRRRMLADLEPYLPHAMIGPDGRVTFGYAAWLHRLPVPARQSG